MSAAKKTEEPAFQSTETATLVKASKAELLQAFDRKSARFAILEQELAGATNEIEELNDLLSAHVSNVRAAQRELQLAFRDGADLKELTNNLVILAGNVLHWSPNSFSETRLDQKLEVMTEQVNDMIDARHHEQEAEAGMMKSDEDNSHRRFLP